jgi:hypothetical protein
MPITPKDHTLASHLTMTLNSFPHQETFQPLYITPYHPFHIIINSRPNTNSYIYIYIKTQNVIKTSNRPNYRVTQNLHINHNPSQHSATNISRPIRSIQPKTPKNHTVNIHGYSSKGKRNPFFT